MFLVDKCKLSRVVGAGYRQTVFVCSIYCERATNIGRETRPYLKINCNMFKLSSRCARGGSCIARETEVHAGGFWVRSVFQGVALWSYIPASWIMGVFPVLCNIDFVSVLTATNNTRSK